jgi:two-component system cell cycle response regulator
MKKRSLTRPSLPLSVPLLLYCLAVVLGTLLVAAGRFEAERTGGLALFSFLLISGLSLWGASSFARKLELPRQQLIVARYTGLLVLAWMAYRFVSPSLWQVGLLPVMLVGYFTATRPIKSLIIPLSAALIMEFGLFVSGSQSLFSLLASLLTLFILVFFLSPFLAPRISLFPNKKAGLDDSGKNPALYPASPTGEQHFLKTVSQNVSSEDAISLISSSLHNLLQTGRFCLKASTLALLWPTADGNYSVREIFSERGDLLAGPFNAGSGLIAGLQQKDRILISEPRLDGPKLPFYADNSGIGAIYLHKIPLLYQESEGGDKKHMHAILTVDFEEERDFDDKTKALIDQLIVQLQTTLHLEKTVRLLSLDRDRIRTVCDGLHQLNGVLGLDSVFLAATTIVKGLVPFDFLAISLLHGDHHRVVKTAGQNEGIEEGQEFAIDDGLVGQVLKRNHWLPAGATYREPAPIFSNSIKHKNFRSLIILPLRNEDNRPMGALTVAARKPLVITRQRRDLLEVVAAQVAVKIDLAEAHEKINQLATTDGLTGLANHRTFQHGFNMMLERAKRNQCPLCLILCDIDHFKSINDLHGHPFGDKVLKSVADVLARAGRKVDLAARYGGEEFAMLLEYADAKGGRQMAERIRKEIEKLVIVDGKKNVKVTLSLGLSFFPKDAADKEELISFADQALYKAKSLGRNRTVAWSDIAGGKS